MQDDQTPNNPRAAAHIAYEIFQRYPHLIEADGVTLEPGRPEKPRIETTAGDLVFGPGSGDKIRAVWNNRPVCAAADAGTVAKLAARKILRLRAFVKQLGS